MNRHFNQHFFIVIIFIKSLSLADPAEYQLNLFKDNLSWNWQGRFLWDSGEEGRSRFYLLDGFSSNLFVQSRVEDKWRDENNLTGYWSHHLSNTFSTATHVKSQVYSDQNSFVKFSKHLFFQELGVKLDKGVTISPSLGWTTEDIYNYRDQGFYSQMKMDISRLDFSGYENNTNGFSSLFIFSGRRNQDHRYYTSFKRKFSDQADDSLQVGYEYVDNRYPLPPSVNQPLKVMEDVVINSRYLYNNLNYRISGSSLFQVETKLQSRDVSQSNPNLLNHREELNFANRIGYLRTGQRLTSSMGFTTSQISNLSSRLPAGSRESRTDIDGLQSAINLMLDWRMTTRDNLRLSFSYTKYEYTSPDTTQSVDEDDVRFILDMQYQHKFSQHFTVRLSSNLYFYHQIYIHPSRSANNNWNRIYQLVSSFRYRFNEALGNNYTFKILANYTVFDFEEYLPEVRSYIFRKLIFSDTLNWRFTPGMRVQAIYQLEQEDNGTFFQDIFAQQISRELQSHLVDLGLVYFRIQGVEVTTGVNWYIRKEWSYLPERELTRNYFAFSPRFTITYQRGRHLALYATYSPRQYRDIQGGTQYFTTGRLNLRYYF